MEESRIIDQSFIFGTRNIDDAKVNLIFLTCLSVTKVTGTADAQRHLYAQKAMKVFV